MELKRTYKGVMLWMAGFFLALFGAQALPIPNADVKMRLACCVMAAGVAVLTYIIERTGFIYWYNGVTYEEAVAAGEARRAAYAYAHRKRFMLAAQGCVVFSLVMQLLGASCWIDFAVVCLALIGTAISTIGIKL